MPNSLLQCLREISQICKFLVVFDEFVILRALYLSKLDTIIQESSEECSLLLDLSKFTSNQLSALGIISFVWPECDPDTILVWSPSPGDFPLNSEKVGELCVLVGAIDNEFVPAFIKEQRHWYPTELRCKDQQDLNRDAILPIQAVETISYGNTAVVRKVIIPGEYLDDGVFKNHPALRIRTESGVLAHQFALKSYESHERATWQCEADAYAIVEGQPYYPRRLCSFRYLKHLPLENSDLIGENTPLEASPFHTLLELGLMDLEQLMRKTSPPLLSSDIASFWHDMVPLIKGVSFIHDTGSGRYGFHHDIKPANVVLFQSGFKLSDLGFTRFFDSVDTAVFFSPDICTKSYGPPDFSDANFRLVSDLQKVDIWSVGCVFSEIATWITLGPGGPEKYRQFRSEHLRQLHENAAETETRAIRRGDYFHDGKMVLRAVKSWHQYLRLIGRRSDLLTAQILDIIENYLFVSLEDRCREGLNRLLERLNKLGDSRVKSEESLDQQLLDFLSSGLSRTHVGFQDPDID